MNDASSDLLLLVDAHLVAYIETCILPRYADFDAAHRRSHAESVMARSLEMARGYDVSPNMVYAIAAYHDLGLAEGRATHHLASGRIVREDTALRQWFAPSEIETMAEAVEDHRASADHAPRSIYGRIVAEADRLIEPATIVRRTVQYGLAHYPQLSPEEHIERAMGHLDEKYGPHGYLKLWIPGSDNERNLRALWRQMEDRDAMRSYIDEVFRGLCSEGDK